MRALALTASLAIASCLVACGTTEAAPEGCGTSTCPAAYEALFATTTAGTYVVTVVFDGYPSTDVTCDVAAGTSGHCTSSDPQVPVSGTFDATGITIDVVNSAQSITFAVTRDGTTVYAGTRTPSYAPAYPNGENCDPICTEAEDMLSLP